MNMKEQILHPGLRNKHHAVKVDSKEQFDDVLEDMVRAGYRRRNEGCPIYGQDYNYLKTDAENCILKTNRVIDFIGVIYTYPEWKEKMKEVWVRREKDQKEYKIGRNENGNVWLIGDNEIQTRPEAITQIWPLPEKKIIGYKAPFDLYGGRVQKGDVFPKESLSGTGSYRLSKELVTFYIPMEIVETWEPVYREDNSKRIAELEKQKADIEKEIETLKKC